MSTSSHCVPPSSRSATPTNTTIAEIESKWGAHYLGWAQPWFKINH